MKKFIIRLLIYLIFFSILSNFRQDSFRVSKIISPQKTAKEVFLNAELRSILKQKFYYLAKGRQCFAFESSDGKYVIKLLNQRRFTLPWPLTPFTVFSSIKKIKKFRNARKAPSFKSYQLAFKYLQDETQILHIQMDSQSRSHFKIRIKDKASSEYEIDLFNTEFVLQKKVEPIYKCLTNLYYRNKKQFKEVLNSFLEIVAKRLHKNIADDDYDIKINYGVLNKKAVLIDPGRIFFNKGLINLSLRKKEMLKSTRQIRKWINENYPEMIHFFDKSLESKI